MSYNISRDPFNPVWLDTPSTTRSLSRMLNEGFSVPSIKQPKLDYRMNVDDEALHLMVDVPGVKPDDLSVEHLDGFLTVKAIRGDTDLSLSVKINNEFDMEAPTAKLEYGVLTIDIPRRPKPTANKITIEVKT